MEKDIKGFKGNIIFFVVLLLFVILLNSTCKVFANTSGTYTDSNGVSYTEYDGNYTVTGYNGTSNEVIIPEIVNGKIVDVIGWSAFQSKSSIISIGLPDTITSIGNNAFDGCSDLKSISIPNGVTSIGDYTFLNCSEMTSVAIPNGVTYLGSSAFQDCIKLTNITIPSSVTRMNGSFVNCSGLTSIIIPDGVTSIGSFMGCSSLTSITIPDSVTSMCNSEFNGCSSLTSVKIPDSVTNIGYQTFSGCSSLKSIAIPNGVTSISEGAFSNCSGLTNIAIPNGVTSIGDWAFSGCSSLTNITIPNEVMSIGDSAFSSCNSLTSIIIPKGVTSIGSSEFTSCYNLRSITIPSGVTSIDNYAFASSDSDLKILGFTNSYANTYANIKGYQFESLGDVYDQNLIVKFKTNCVTTIPDTLVKFDSLITNTPELVKDGWEFGGWYKDSTFSIPFNINSYKVNNDITLYAKWIAIVSFDAQGGNAIAPLQVANISKISQPNNPVKSGYTFGGWYKENNCTNLWDFSTDEISKGTSLYAKWTINKYKTTFDSQGGSLVESINVQYNKLITSPTIPTKEGYTFCGWYKNSDCTLSWNFETSLVKYDMTLYAKWIINNYIVSFKSQDGSVVSNKCADYNSTVTVPASPTKIGYTFGGWYKEVECINIWNFTTEKVIKDTILFSKWSINSNTVIFNSQGGSIVGSKITNHNSTITAPALPIKTGYTFGGWYKESECINAWNFTTEKVIIDTKLYAKWAINSNAVIFNSQGGSVVKSKTANYNSLITMPTPPTKTGYTFAGWYKEAGCINIWNFATNKMVSNTTLFAKWIAIPPSIPKSVISTSSSYNSINVTWNKVTGANGYDIARSTSSNGTYTTIARVISSSYNNGGLATGITYYYKVKSFKTVGGARLYSNPWSNIVSAKPLPSTVVKVKSASSSYCTTNTTWNKVTGASGYEVFRSTSSKGTYTIVARVISLNYNNGGLILGRTYYYKVRSYRTVGNARVYCNYWSNIANAKPLLVPVANVKSTRTSSKSIKTTWNRVTGASGYEVFRATSSKGSYTIIARTSNSSFINVGLTKGRTYYYKVRSYRYVGSKKVYCNYWSNIVSARP